MAVLAERVAASHTQSADHCPCHGNAGGTRGDHFECVCGARGDRDESEVARGL